MNKYMKIYQSICEKILNGEYAHLQQLPSENELTKIYSTSRETVRKALNLLQEKGYIQKLRGKGSVVIYEDVIQFPISEMVSFQEINKRLGLDYETKVELLEVIDAKDVPVVQHALELRDQDKLWHVIRTRTKDDAVRIMDEDYFKCQIIPQLTEEVAAESIYKFIEQEMNVEISYSNKSITFEEMTENEILYFGKLNPPYTATVRGTVYLNNAEKFQYNISRHIATEFKFVDFSRRVIHKTL
ncbi:MULTISPECIES: trehalose operon repressor [Mammaliicoccus]|uniref:Trehalose operon repressor n=1 Tax=Mammaliicoccus sciuri TaxID=1296 RepID=A0AAJ4SHJ7_MAMSC|nr:MULTISPECIES: trehalose operon repressor [Mammaliicoccus]MCJ0914344.1 trehalose operon repressor [Mammaliicoccus sciuri]MCJ1749928.1 trehalose operon repressor [Mammaliicoccus sciuri]MDL0112943.1 trehalose operon repressor [Mammaliicoccus sciuri]MDL0117450.1 trehalose operon repressor [Mammaliicoccus sciuri]RTX72634.1 trehalose operon repressor [Mammaliicoccus sciuri]